MIQNNILLKFSKKGKAVKNAESKGITKKELDFSVKYNNDSVAVISVGEIFEDEKLRIKKTDTKLKNLMGVENEYCEFCEIMASNKNNSNDLFNSFQIDFNKQSKYFINELKYKEMKGFLDLKIQCPRKIKT